MAAPLTTSTTAPDLHRFLEGYERDFPNEVVHVETPIDAEFELTALAAKLEKEKRFPLLIFHDVRIDGERSEMPLVSFMMASRLRLARLLGVDVPEAGLACYQRMQHR